MGYITNLDIEERLGHALYVQLTDDEGTGMADEDKVDEAQLGAEGEVNSYLGLRYRVPVDVLAQPGAAGVLRSMTLDLAEYRLHARRSPVPEEAKAKHDAAVRWLDAVASGRAVLPSAGDLDEPTANGMRAAATGAERVLTREEMKGL